jgi:hypothetical protein
MTLHEEVLAERQKGALESLGPVARSRGFYLAGGVALGLRLGHRRSVDLDWFAEQPVGDPVVLAELIRRSGVDFVTGSVEAGTLRGSVNGVPVSMIEYLYPTLQPPDDRQEIPCRIASPEDLACMKLSAIVHRGARKDFVDIYALGVCGLPPGRAVDLYRRKYGTQDTGHVVYALSYFDDAERQPMPEMLWAVEWPEIVAKIRGWVERL